MDYKVVEFLDTDTVDWIPETWLIGLSECQYPKVRNSITTRLKASFSQPEEDWKTYQIRILGSASTEEEARERTRRAEWTSELSDGQGKRTIKRPTFFTDAYNEYEKPIKRRNLKIKQVQDSPLPPFPSLRRNTIVSDSNQSTLINASQNDEDEARDGVNSVMLPASPCLQKRSASTSDGASLMIDSQQTDAVGAPVGTSSVEIQTAVSQSLTDSSSESVSSIGTSRNIPRLTTIGSALHSGIVGNVKKSLIDFGLDPLSPEALLTIMTLTYRKTAEAESMIKRNIGESSTSQKSILSSLPFCHSFAEVLAMENRFRQETSDAKSYRKKLMERLLLERGSTLKESVRRVVDGLIARSVQVRFNRTGSDQKHAFKGPLEQFVVETMFHLHEDICTKDIETEVALVLKKAADWLFKREPKEEIVRKRRNASLIDDYVPDTDNEESDESS